ncbi:MAG TPA: UDP-N-acetylmuramate--L-alanine ligase [Candidatus Dormibacteraeota bacterium]
MTRIHMMGIGGVGVSALARVYLARGEEVSGCDVKETESLVEVENEGARVSLGHDPEHVLTADWLVHSAAVRDGEPELEAARAMGVRVLTRAEGLAELFAATRSIAVAGSAGKTTITHMLGHVLTEAGYDPTTLVGDGRSSRVGGSDWLVAEADESDGSLVLHHPRYAIVSNVHYDHPDHFAGIEQVAEVFQEFLHNLPAEGIAVLGADDERAAALHSPARRVSYGFADRADYRCTPERPFRLWHGDRELGSIELRVPGRHNVENATAAAAMALELGLSFDQVSAGLAGFTGAHRRLERLGTWQGATLYDDYAHHPKKVQATLSAARELPYRRLIAVFQPHRYSRTAGLLDEFAGSFEEADAVLVTDIYGAGEENPTRITGENLALKMRNARYTPDFASVREALEDLAGRGDLVLFMGAGDIGKLGRELADHD